MSHKEIKFMDLLENKEWLYQKYIVEKISIEKISRILNCRQCTVSRALKNYSITKDNPIYQDEKWLTEQYVTQNKSAAQIGKEIHVCPQTINRWIRRYNLEQAENPYKDINWVRNQLKIYNGSVPKIAEATGFNVDTLWMWIRKHKINVEAHYYRKHDFNVKYFKAINDEHKAYWIGFLMADGNMDKSLGQITINIQAEDGYILETLNNDINGNYEVKYTPEEHDKYGIHLRKAKSSISISSYSMCKDLVYHGIVPLKSGKEILPKTIPQELIPHFIRGFLDGDGHISNKIKRVEFCSASMNILSDIKLYCENILKIPEHNLVTYVNKDNRGFYYYKLNGNNAIILLNTIYKDATIFLKRKYETYLTYSPSN